MAKYEESKLNFETTKRAVIWTNLLNEPLQVLFFSFISVILYRDLGATSFQIAVLTMLRPVVSILSLYWSVAISKRQEKLVSNVIFTSVLARLPFFFFPFFTNPWFIIVCSTSYMMLSRGGLPAWIEVMKQNLPEEKRGKIFSYSSAVSYLEGVVLSLGMGVLLDKDQNSWKWLFPLAAAIGLLGIGLKAFIPEKAAKMQQQTTIPPLKELIINPWKESWQLVNTNPSFFKFQWGFMLAGSAIMLMQPALPIFFVDYLKVTYLDLAIALSVCKGLGFALTSHYWTSLLNKASIYETSNKVFLLLIAFPLFLILALFHPLMLYIAYFFYGIAQSGSHLVWHMSGALFADDKDSNPYSNVNILTVGIRGAIVPPLGSLLTILSGPIAVFSISAFFCYIAQKVLFKKNKVHQKNPI